MVELADSAATRRADLQRGQGLHPVSGAVLVAFSNEFTLPASTVAWANFANVVVE